MKLFLFVAVPIAALAAAFVLVNVLIRVVSTVLDKLSYL